MLSYNFFLISHAALQARERIATWSKRLFRLCNHKLHLNMTVIVLTGLLLTVPYSAFSGVTPWIPETEPAEGHLSIQVARSDWGSAKPETVERLLIAVADEFQTYVRPEQEQELKIHVVPHRGSPRVLYDRGPEDEYIVHLSARDERWYQYTYQFTHELCHIFSNFDHKERDHKEEVATHNQWFEESLCETASLFILRRLAINWEQHLPTRKWADYGPILASYADYLLAQTHRKLAPTQSLNHWYKEHQASLQENPYLRKKNELVATTLLQLFEQHPHLWQAITSLNRDRSSAGKPFPDYLSDWYSDAPLKSKPLAAQTMLIFGIPSFTAASPIHSGQPTSTTYNRAR